MQSALGCSCLCCAFAVWGLLCGATLAQAYAFPTSCCVRSLLMENAIVPQWLWQTCLHVPPLSLLWVTIKAEQRQLRLELRYVLYITFEVVGYVARCDV
jgi:hypothetical protein